jgi:hypothetical protein
MDEEDEASAIITANSVDGQQQQQQDALPPTL